MLVLHFTFVNEPNNSARNTKLIEHHINNIILISSGLTHFVHDPNNILTYFQIVKTTLGYLHCRTGYGDVIKVKGLF